MWILWLLFCIGVGVFASKKGRSGFGWFIISCIITPLFGAIIVACLKDLNVEKEIQHVGMEQEQMRNRVAANERLTEYRLNRVENDIDKIQTRQENYLGNPAYNQRQQIVNQVEPKMLEGELKKCPNCGNSIKMQAIKCKFCGADIPEVKMVECPYCKELIRSDAIRCKHCKSDLNQTVIINQ